MPRKPPRNDAPLPPAGEPEPDVLPIDGPDMAGLPELPDDPGLRRQGFRPTREQIRSLLDVAKQLVKRRFLKSDMKRTLREMAARIFKRGKPISARTCEKYISRAREIVLRERALKNPDEPSSREEYRYLAIEFYESILQAPGSDMKERLHAQARIDAIMGVDAPIKTANLNANFTEDQSVLRQAMLKDPRARQLAAELAEQMGGLSSAEPASEPDQPNGVQKNGTAGHSTV